MKRKERTSMDRQLQIIELHKRKYSIRRIAKSLKMCKKTIGKYVKKYEEEKFLQNEFKNKKEQKELYLPGKKKIDPNEILSRYPEWVQSLNIDELFMDIKKGVTYKTLFKEINPSEVKYWTFWSTLTRLKKELFPLEPKTTMRMVHKPGEKAFVDYGDGIDLIDPKTGEITKTWIFVGTLPFSSKVYAEFVFDQKCPSFIASHERMWKYFGGVAQYTVTDNLKSSVIKAHIYDPDLNKTFCSYANHAGFAVLPARPRKPKDKANVECHVGILQKSFFQEVRNKSFSTIGELNQCLLDFLYNFNNNIMKDYGVSRNQRFETEMPNLQPLPKTEFEIPEIREATVHPDCHIQCGKMFYSVPWQYVGKKVRVLITKNKVQIYDIISLEKIAFHCPGRKIGERKTDPLHWPPEKREHCDFTVERAKDDAKKIGIKTYDMVNYLFSLRHPLVYLRRVQGWVRRVSFGKCTRESMEYAATLALEHKNFSSQYINNCSEMFDNRRLVKIVKAAPPKRDNFNIYVRQ